MAQAGADGDEIGVHQFNQRAAKKEVEADERHQGRGLVEHFAGSLFYLAALFDEIGFQHVPEAAEAAQRDDHFFQRLAPVKRRGADLAQNRFHHYCDVVEFDLLVVDLRGSAEREILDQEEVRLVAIHVGFRRLAQMALDEGAKSGFAGIQRGHLE